MWTNGVGGYVNTQGEWIETTRQKTAIGISLTKDDWIELSDTMKYLSKINAAIRNEPLCSERHNEVNQTCNECSPFQDTIFDIE